MLKRWKNLWLLIPLLAFAAADFPNYNAFGNFVNKFIYISRVSSLHKVKLIILRDENDQSCVTRWIDSVVKHKLKHLDVECHGKR